MDFKDLADEQVRFIEATKEMLEALGEFATVCSANRPTWNTEPFIRAIEVQRETITRTTLAIQTATAQVQKHAEDPQSLH